MPSFFKFNKYFALLATLLAVSTSVRAEGNLVGDWWIIYGTGVASQNVMYVADLTSVVPSNKTKGAKVAAVTIVYEYMNKPVIDVYNMEVKCAERKMRFLDGQSVKRFDYSLRHLTVSTQWQDVKEPWVQRTFAFVCAPGNRNNNDMLAMGKMEYMQMIQTAQAMFEKMGPSQKRNQMIDDLDTLLGNEK